MPRGPRNTPGGLVYHALNRGVGRRTLFHKDADFAAFERLMCEALRRFPTMRLLAYCLMGNHWHQVLWPRGDGDLSAYLRWLTHTHTQRYHAHYHTAGTGHLYQGRFKSFAVQSDEHVLAVSRYVERNALRARLVTRAQDWRWASLWRRGRGVGDLPLLPMDEWPLEFPPANWVSYVNEPQSDQELAALRHSVQRSCPFGTEAWQTRIAAELGLASTLRPQGRPRRTTLAIADKLRRRQPVL